MPRPVPWVPPALYGAVLAGGVYYAAVGPGLGPRTAGFAGLLGALIFMDSRDLPLPPAVSLAVRIALFAGVSAFDVSGLSLP